MLGGDYNLFDSEHLAFIVSLFPLFKHQPCLPPSLSVIPDLDRESSLHSLPFLNHLSQKKIPPLILQL